MTECIALLRGINVGRAKRIAMADLRGLFVDLGHKEVRTLLNSGNVLFQCARPNTGKLALRKLSQTSRTALERASPHAIGLPSSNCKPRRMGMHDAAPTQNCQGTLDAAYRRRVLSPPRTTRP
jgi:hypothetical protein